MCELCDLKAKADKKREQYSFRIMQMQMDIQEGRPKEAAEAKELAKAAFGECLDIVEEHAQKVLEERHADSLPLSISDILRGSQLN